AEQTSPYAQHSRRQQRRSAMSVSIISFKERRQANVVAKATEMLRDVLSAAAELTAENSDLSANDCIALTTDLLRTLRDFDDASGWYVARCRPDSVHPMAAAALHDFLRVAAANAEIHLLTAENRALIINCVFMALGGGWKVIELPVVAAEQA